MSRFKRQSRGDRPAAPVWHWRRKSAHKRRVGFRSRARAANLPWDDGYQRRVIQNAGPSLLRPARTVVLAGSLLLLQGLRDPIAVDGPALGARNKVEAVLRATAMGAANGHDEPRC